MKRDASGQILATLFSAVLWWKHWSTLLGRGPPPPCVYSFSFFFTKTAKTHNRIGSQVSEFAESLHYSANSG